MLTPAPARQCKKVKGGVSKLDLFAQAFAEMLGAALKHHAIARRISDQDPGFGKPSEHVSCVPLLSPL
jgi:hypothetical protein